jgi:hypothetical protein
MKTVPSSDSLAIPPDLLAEIQAEAEKENRSAGAVLRDLVERGLGERRRIDQQTQSAAAKPTPAEAVARILELRKGNVLPEGVTIRDLMTHGRA